jgi:hypothetical protein
MRAESVTAMLLLGSNTSTATRSGNHQIGNLEPALNWSLLNIWR